MLRVPLRLYEIILLGSIRRAPGSPEPLFGIIGVIHSFRCMGIRKAFPPFLILKIPLDRLSQAF